jgi:hypothetical protein
MYDLPFGRGKALAGNVNGAVDRLIGGWTLSGVTIRHSGVPYTVSIGSFPTGYLGENTVSVSFPDRGTASPYAGAAHNASQWFLGCSVAQLQNNTCGAFVLPAQNALGNYGINNLYGPGYMEQDVALQKHFGSIADKYKFTFRIDAFNIFNHPNLGAPNTNITSTTAGQITSSAGNMRRLQFALRMDF